MHKTDNNFATTKELSVPVGMENANSKEILDYLFANNNRLLTAYAGELALPKDTQNLIAYFSGGEIIISRTHKYDGRVLAFIDLLNALNSSDVREAIYYVDKEIIPMIKSKESMRFFLDMLVQAFEDLLNLKCSRDITLKSYATILGDLKSKLPHINESLLEIMKQRNIVNLNVNNSLQLDHLIIYITKEKL